MKRSFFTVLFALICTLGFSQVSFNVKAGLNLSSYIGENSDNSKFKPGVRLGVGMEYQFNEMVALQPSLFFSQKGAKYSGDYKGNIADADADVKINQLYLELPINVQFRFNIADNTNLVVNAGPYLACGIAGKSKMDMGNVEYKEDTFGDDALKRFDAGLGVGVALEFGKIIAGLEGQFGLVDVQKVGNPKNMNFSIVVGYKF